MRTRTKKSLRNRFDEKWESNPNNGCCEWIAGVTEDGYGRIRNRKDRLLAHRVSWILHIGDIPDSLFVLHKCDNRLCIRPSHLYLGDHNDNMKDMSNRGRHHDVTGTKHHFTTLSNYDVLLIRDKYKIGMTCLAISKLLIISKNIIYQVCGNQTWTHLLNRTMYDGPDTMPKLLFIVTHDNKVLYYCHSVLELFRLRKVYNPPPESKVYRYIDKASIQIDCYFTWDKIAMWWLASDKHTGIGFNETSFEIYEPAYKMLGGK